MSDIPEAVEWAASGDGSRRWRLLRRPDGLYAYEEETFQKEICWVDEDGGERDVAAEAYWKPTRVSGLFDTIDAARSDAFGALPWLRDPAVNIGANGH